MWVLTQLGTKHSHKYLSLSPCILSLSLSLSLSVSEAGDSQVTVNAPVVQGEAAGQLVSRGAPSVHRGVHNSPFYITRAIFLAQPLL